MTKRKSWIDLRANLVSVGLLSKPPDIAPVLFLRASIFGHFFDYILSRYNACQLLRPCRLLLKIIENWIRCSSLDWFCPPKCPPKVEVVPGLKSRCPGPKVEMSRALFGFVWQLLFILLLALYWTDFGASFAPSLAPKSRMCKIYYQHFKKYNKFPFPK